MDEGGQPRSPPSEPAILGAMADFPDFVKNPKNRIAASSELTPDIEGYLFDGADGSQAALWRCDLDRSSVEHTHDFDEWVYVLEGRCTAFVGDETIELSAGQELFVPKGTRQRMAVSAGTRTLHVFGGRRASRTIE